MPPVISYSLDLCHWLQCLEPGGPVNFPCTLFIHLTSPGITNLATGMLRDMSRPYWIRACNVRCPSPVQSACHLIAESNQVGQAWFTLHKDFLTLPSVWRQFPGIFALELFHSEIRLTSHLLFMGPPSRPALPDNNVLLMEVWFFTIWMKLLQKFTCERKSKKMKIHYKTESWMKKSSSSPYSNIILKCIHISKLFMEVRLQTPMSFCITGLA